MLTIAVSSRAVEGVCGLATCRQSSKNRAGTVLIDA
jgi:hypothetical protein